MSYWEEIEANKRLLEQEVGAVVADWGGRLPVALVYSNTYAVGMSSLGLHALYGMLVNRPDVACERIFDDGKWDGSATPRSIETQSRLDEFGLWAFSLSFELDYLNAVNLIRRSGVASLARDRGEGDPILIAGGPAVSANPMPLAHIFDAFFIGEVEEQVGRIGDLAVRYSLERERLLQLLSEVPGVFVPSIHHGQGGAPVRRQWVQDLDRYATRSVIWTPNAEFGDMHLVEVSRGCRRGCRFCLAGYTTRPWRERSLAAVLDAVRPGMAYRNKIGLVGAAISDYAAIDELVVRLREMELKISVSSLRADSVSPTLLDALADSGSRTLTVAPEAGSERLRGVIGKGISEEDVLRVAEMAAARDFAQLKLYFMLGLPTETDEDVLALVSLVEKVSGVFPRQVAVNMAPFVPKAHTPFQWEAAPDPRTVRRRLRDIEKRLRRHRVRVRSDSPEWAQVQAALALGDESLGPVLLGLEKPSLSAWKGSLRSAGVSVEAMTGGRATDEPLPWDMIDSGIRPSFLKGAANHALSCGAPVPCVGTGKGCVICGICD